MTALTSLFRPTSPICVSAKVALLAVVSTQFLAAATYYVSPAGNDSNPGVESAPFRTIARGVSAVGAGDVIVLEDGTYGNEGKISDRSGGTNGYATPVNINKAGTPNGYITLKARNRWKAILDCGTWENTMGCDKNIYLAAGAAYWSFEDMIFTRGAWGGIGTDVGAHHIRIKGNLFQDIGYFNNTTQIGESAIGYDKTSTDWWIEGNVIHNVGRMGTAILDHGIYAAGKNATVINNLFYNLTDGWAISMGEGATNWLIGNNTFAFPHTSQSGHIMFWNTNTGIIVKNNIFYNPGTYAIMRYQANISGCSLDHNMIVGASLMADTSGCSVDSNITTSDPKFTNVANWDFSLAAGSPAIDKGAAAVAATDIVGTPRPQGAGTDIGAWEFAPSVSGPSISGIAATGITSGSAVISWATNTPGTSYVQFGYFPGVYSFISPVDSNLTTVHSVTLTGLSQGTDYYFVVGSKDANGNVTVSAQGIFQTPSVTAGGGSGSPGSGSGSTGGGSTPPTQIAATPVAAWDFSSNTGNTAVDSSGNNNTATLSNVSWRGDICAGCVTFSGINSYINVPESASLNLGSQLTVAMWVMAGASKGLDQRLISKNYSWDVKLNGASRYPQFSGGGGYAVMATPLQAGAWQHVVMTFANGTVKGYMNGNPVTFRENTYKGGETITNWTYGLRIGADSEAANNFTGTMDDVRLYNRVLSATDVATLYATTMHSSKNTSPRRARVTE